MIEGSQGTDRPRWRQHVETPPTSVAWKTYQRWVQHVGGFLMHVWHDPRFDDRAATAFTRWAVGELQRRAGGKWHWALPHFFGSLTEALDVETDRRRLLALTTIRSSVAGGGMSAVRRLLGNSRQLGLQDSLRDWRAQLEELRDSAPPLVQAVLRDVIACLGSLQGKAG